MRPVMDYRTVSMFPRLPHLSNSTEIDTYTDELSHDPRSLTLLLCLQIRDRRGIDGSQRRDLDHGSKSGWCSASKSG